MNNIKANAVLMLALAVLCGGLNAEPAPWWKWRSKIDGQLFCSQTQLGPGWEKAYGPFRDARCEKLIVVR
ncbi:hypothetical protein SAMN05216319_0443 [Duganella sp. CF402]|uniref:hypothetical protein n=1 Tax=unclassified Duganella TaxID=2636909 RepID=UPI0008B5DABA|nr:MULTISPECIES: hypothetical protein [unclassified Duganella]RZT11080.1 hypothetical protein EV582_3183 [Duganella sp. BK701]SEK82392.1 hypothetical protein SAMN05216319_0443 [Duganella sp. CF402]